MRRPVLALAAAALALSVTGCGADDDPFTAYCDEVQAQQTALSEALAGAGPTALIEALPSFEALAEKAPGDIADEWTTLTNAIEGLVETLAEADVDPSTYDREQPPDGVSAEEQQDIDVAARRLTQPETARALEAVQQQALDVCKTPLSL